MSKAWPEKASKALTDAYVAAFNKGDAKALGAMYADYDKVVRLADVTAQLPQHRSLAIAAS